MAGRLEVFFLLVIFLGVLTSSGVMAKKSSAAVKGVYYPSWAFSGLPPSAINTRLFTHVYYAFLSPNNVTFMFDVSESTALQLVNFTSTLSRKNPPVKTLFSVGGAGEGAALFSRMASTVESRKNFVDSSIEVARKFGFDGIDLDWEFPQNPKDMDNFGLLLQEWRIKVRTEAETTGQPALLLTAAVYFAVDFFLDQVYRKYPVASINENLDWVNAMCYDYHGSWEPKVTGAHAALFDPTGRNLSTSHGLGSWIEAGIRRNKLIMGLPLYGKTWVLKDPKINKIGSEATGLGPGDLGVLTYAEIESFNKENVARKVYDMATVSTYSLAGSTWIGYDDVTSTSVKIVYAQTLRLRGYFFWAANGDLGWKISKQASLLWVREQ